MVQNPHHYLVPQQRIPGYLPYANPVSPGSIPVPNASSINWPQAQFAEPFVPAGTPSFSPYRYPDYTRAVHYGDIHDAHSNPGIMGFVEENKTLIAVAAVAVILYKTGYLDKILGR